MNINFSAKYNSNYKMMNFDHLMKIYENNYYLFKDVFRLLDNNNSLSTITINNNVMQYEPVTISKYTDIFRFYYKYKPHGLTINSYSIRVCNAFIDKPINAIGYIILHGFTPLLEALFPKLSSVASTTSKIHLKYSKPSIS